MSNEAMPYQPTVIAGPKQALLVTQKQLNL